MSVLILDLPFGTFDVFGQASAGQPGCQPRSVARLFENRLLNLGSIRTRVGFDLLDQEFTVIREFAFPAQGEGREQVTVPVELSVEAIERHIAGLGYDARMHRLGDEDRMLIECLRGLEIMTPSYACASGQIAATNAFWLSVLPLGHGHWGRYRSLPAMRQLDDLATAVLGMKLSSAQPDAVKAAHVGSVAAITGLASVMVEYVRVRQIAFEVLRRIQEQGLNRLVVGDTNSDLGKAAMRNALLRLQRDLSFLAEIEKKLGAAQLAQIDWRGAGALLLESYCSCLRLRLFTRFVVQRSSELTRRIPGYEIEVMLGFINELPQGLTSFGSSSDDRKPFTARSRREMA